MDFALTPDLLELKRSIAAFTEKEFGNKPYDIPRESLDLDAWRRCADFGIQALPVPAAYGGLDRDLMACAIVMQTLAHGCRDSRLLFALSAHFGTFALPILRFGTDAQKNEYLPAMSAGRLIGGHTLDTVAPNQSLELPLTATKTTDGYLLDNAACMVTHPSNAHVFLVFAAVEEQPPSSDNHPPPARTTPPDRYPPQTACTALLIRRDTQGLDIGPTQSIDEPCIAPTASLAFHGCEVRESDVLGRVHGGRDLLTMRFRWELCCLLACALGRMERQLADCLSYTRDRRQFGKPISEFQAVAHKLADMKVRIELGRVLLEKIAWMESHGQDALMFVAIAKLFIGRGYIASSRDAVHLHGGYGYMRESGMPHSLDAALAQHSYQGAADVQRDIIAYLLGIRTPNRQR